MTIFSTTLILFFGSLLAGCLGALSGLGGGLIIVPLIVLGLGGDIHYAIGTSLIAVIATSTASSCAYVREGYTNVRIGIFLETATTIGALCGVAVGSMLSGPVLSHIFGVFLLYCAISTVMNGRKPEKKVPQDKLATWLELNGNYPSQGGICDYFVKQVPWGYTIMFLAGCFSGLLGIGSGVLKVVALDGVMGIPFKVSTTTSNFMIGVTAAASAGLYLSMGYIDPILTMPTVIGVTLGSLVGSRLLPKMHTKYLRLVFAGLVLIISFEMIFGVI